MVKKFIFSFIFFVVFVGLLEITSRILESYFTTLESINFESPGWQTEFFSSLFDWNEPDPDLLWRFKANLSNPLIKTNADHLLGNDIPLEKKIRNFRILLLGDSSPVGLGLTSFKQTFAELLRYHLEIKFIDYKIELINAAVPGYTSEQIVRFMELRGWRYNPDLVIVYCGNNDASISGPMSDRELLEAQRFTFLRRQLSRLAVYRIMRSLWIKKGRESAENNDILKVRVEAERFGENLNRLVGESRSHHCPVIILKPPVPYLWPAGLQFKIFTRLTGKEGKLVLPEKMINILGRPLKYCLDVERFNRLYGQGDMLTKAVYASAFTDTLSPSKAINYYTTLIERDSTDPVLYNNLGVSFWAGGDFIRADSNLNRARKMFCRNYECNGSDKGMVAAGSPFLYNIGINLLTKDTEQNDDLNFSASPAYFFLDSALQTDYFSLRIKGSYWREIDKFKDIDNVFVLDLPQVFQKSGGERLFIDHCHPTPEGHRLIAETLYNLFLQKNFIR